jgi:hypothetical protein
MFFLAGVNYEQDRDAAGATDLSGTTRRGITEDARRRFK